MFVSLALGVLSGAPALADDSEEDLGATIRATSDKPELMLSMIRGRSTGYGAGVTVNTTYYSDVCIAPCTFQVQPGIREFFGKGGGRVAVAKKLQVQPGLNDLHVQPGSAAGRAIGTYASYLGYVGIAGGVALLTSGFVLGGDSPVPTEASVGMVAGGAVLAVGGIALRVSNKGKWSIKPAGAPASTETTAPL